jgi:hypothetical protein
LRGERESGRAGEEPVGRRRIVNKVRGVKFGAPGVRKVLDVCGVWRLEIRKVELLTV